jgi:hypothetical protein
MYAFKILLARRHEDQEQWQRSVFFLNQLHIMAWSQLIRQEQKEESERAKFFASNYFDYVDDVDDDVWFGGNYQRYGTFEIAWLDSSFSGPDLPSIIESNLIKWVNGRDCNLLFEDILVSVYCEETSSVTNILYVRENIFYSSFERSHKVTSK